MFVIGGSPFVLFSFLLLLSPLARIRLGGSNALGALQAAAITAGLSFSVVWMVMCVSLFLEPRKEHRMHNY